MTIQKNKPVRAKLLKTDLLQEFQEQIHNLDLLNKVFDEGHQSIAKEIAVKLRVLFFHGEGQSRSKSLLKTLKLDHVNFCDSSASYNSKNILTHHGLVGLHMDARGAVYQPFLDTPPVPMRAVDFENWWSKRIVAKDTNGTTYTRKDLVLELANTDGGAHVDEGLEINYHNLTRKNALGWFFVDANGFKAPLGNPVPGSIRQISHEAIETFKNLDIRNESQLR